MRSKKHKARIEFSQDILRVCAYSPRWWSILCWERAAQWHPPCLAAAYWGSSRGWPVAVNLCDTDAKSPRQLSVKGSSFQHGVATLQCFSSLLNNVLSRCKPFPITLSHLAFCHAFLFWRRGGVKAHIHCAWSGERPWVCAACAHHSSCVFAAKHWRCWSGRVLEQQA